MNILFISDIVGRPGRDVIKNHLNGIIKKYAVEFVIANGENTAGGLGITPVVFEELLGYGINVITSGNHIWKRKEVFSIIDHPNLLRPANYPDEAPGHGFNVYNHGNIKIGVINLLGRIFMNNPIDSPFTAVDKALCMIKGVNVVIVDFHAETTSEKIAMSWYLDGKVSALIGTHTHVQTSDARIMPQGTAYMTDAGMTGSRSGVIGVEKEEIIKSFITGMPFGYKGSKGNCCFEGAVIDIDEDTGKSNGTH